MSLNCFRGNSIITARSISQASPKTSRIKWHDTDLIIATSGHREKVAAAAEIVCGSVYQCGVQTLEPVSPSGIYANGANENLDKSIQVSIHRRFLNAYSRVVKGNIQTRLCESSDNYQGGKQEHTVKETNLHDSKDSKMGKGQKPQ